MYSVCKHCKLYKGSNQWMMASSPKLIDAYIQQQDELYRIYKGSPIPTPTPESQIPAVCSFHTSRQSPSRRSPVSARRPKMPGDRSISKQSTMGRARRFLIPLSYFRLRTAPSNFFLARQSSRGEQTRETTRAQLMSGTACRNSPVNGPVTVIDRATFCCRVPVLTIVFPLY